MWARSITYVIQCMSSDLNHFRSRCSILVTGPPCINLVMFFQTHWTCSQVAEGNFEKAVLSSGCCGPKGRSPHRVTVTTRIIPINLHFNCSCSRIAEHRSFCHIVCEEGDICIYIYVNISNRIMYYCRICSAEYAKKKTTLPVPIEILQASLYCLGTVFFFFIPLEGMKQMLMKERGWKRFVFETSLYCVWKFWSASGSCGSMFQPYRFPAPLSASCWFQLCYSLLMYIHMTCKFNCTISLNIIKQTKQNKQNRQTRQRNKRTNEQTNKQPSNQATKQTNKQTNQTNKHIYDMHKTIPEKKNTHTHTPLVFPNSIHSFRNVNVPQQETGNSSGQKTITHHCGTPWKFNIAPEKWWLEDYFPIGKVTFQGLC